MRKTRSRTIRPRRPGPRVTLLLSLLDEAFDRKAWHGPNLRGAIRGLHAGRAAWRPAAGRHSIWDLVVHAAYWKYAVRRRLAGEKRGSFARAGSNWFARADSSEAAWRRDVALLQAEHRRLRDAVAALGEADLSRRVPGRRTRWATLIYGVAAHDVYHAGQIQLVKRLGAAGVD
jgi:uncharacterized damage-inducible protein DinB